MRRRKLVTGFRAPKKSGILQGASSQREPSVAKKKAGSKFSKINVAPVPKHPSDCAILNCLPAHVAVLNPRGTILFTNEAWNRFAEENANPLLGGAAQGANYLEICTRAVSGGTPHAQVILSGVRDVLEGKRKSSNIEYPCDLPTGQRWFTMDVVPRNAARGGAVIVHRDITRHKLAGMDEALRQRQQEIKALLDNSPDVILRQDPQERYAYVNAATARAAGLPPEAFLGKTPREVGLPENLCELWTRTFREVLDSGFPRIIEVSYPSPGGETIWEERVIPEFGAGGAVQSVLTIARDITEKKRMEQAAQAHAQEIRALAASLLTAQEEERRRVSGLLHDKICQQLASLAIDIGGIADQAHAKFVQDRLKVLQARVVKASEETRHIAYELHPSVLDDLGVVASLRSLCKEFSERAAIPVEFAEVALPSSLPREIASCLYRVARESLHNIAQHSGAHHVSVALALRNGAAVLTIEDDGVGFDPEAVRGRGGLGLIVMEERVRLVSGKLSIDALPGDGTRIALEVPLHPGNSSNGLGSYWPMTTC